jgi:GNAT superfamily N-acetyltransferase
MASIGDLHAFTLRVAPDRLVGFCFVQLWPQLPFKGKTLALATELYIDPLYRGTGTKLLLDKTIACMREIGAARFALHHSMQNPAVLAPLGPGVSMRVWARDL